MKAKIRRAFEKYPLGLLIFAIGIYLAMMFLPINTLLQENHSVLFVFSLFCSACILIALIELMPKISQKWKDTLAPFGIFISISFLILLTALAGVIASSLIIIRHNEIPEVIVPILKTEEFIVTGFGEDSERRLTVETSSENFPELDETLFEGLTYGLGDTLLLHYSTEEPEYNMIETRD